MSVRAPWLAVLLLGTGLMSAAAQTGGASSSGRPEAPNAGTSVPEAPIGHRQPRMIDLPPALRTQEEPDPGASARVPASPSVTDSARQTQHKGRDHGRDASGRTPGIEIDTGVPQICLGC
jgi:hypothetical protein